MSSIVVVGSIAFDTIKTPFGTAPKVLGGSANHFALSASHFVPVSVVSVVGEDFPEEHLSILKSRGINVDGIRKAKGKTFHWSGSYSFDMNEAKTLDTHLNVFETFAPQLPPSYRKAPIVFLGNIQPQLQMNVLDQIENPRFVAIDTMNLWIETQREPLIKAIQRCHALIINEAELRQLTKLYNTVRAAELVRSWGPQILVVKRGEYGALLFDHGDAFCIPGLPLAEVKDPTGAGDTFAGGFLGYLGSQSPFAITREGLRKAMVYGCVMASFTVEDFGSNHLIGLEKGKINERYQRFLDLTRFDVN